MYTDRTCGSWSWLCVRGQTAWLTGLSPADAWERQPFSLEQRPGVCRPPQPVSSWPVSVGLGPPSATSAQAENHQFRLERGCSDACFGGGSWREAPRGSGALSQLQKASHPDPSPPLCIFSRLDVVVAGKKKRVRKTCFHRLAHFCRLVPRPR